MLPRRSQEISAPHWFNVFLYSYIDRTCERYRTIVILDSAAELAAFSLAGLLEVLEGDEHEVLLCRVGVDEDLVFDGPDTKIDNFVGGI